MLKRLWQRILYAVVMEGPAEWDIDSQVQRRIDWDRANRVD
jgi:hypothetical protein